MDFTSKLSDDKKKELMEDRLAILEASVYSLSWASGIDPADLPDDYTAPKDAAEAQVQLEDEVKQLVSLKKVLAELE
jgi:hypothetical protein